MIFHLIRNIFKFKLHAIAYKHLDIVVIKTYKLVTN